MLGVERNGRVLVVTLSRAPVNALDDVLLARLGAVIERVEADAEIALLHLKSDQKAFCAGADLALMRACFATPHGPARMLEVARAMQRLFQRIEDLPVVTLAEIGGAAMGGGLELALACDLRLAAIEAKLGLTEMRLGLVPGAGGTQRLTRLCGRGTANRLILGGEILDGAEAVRLGVVHWAVPRERLAERAREIAAHYAGMPRAALAAAKRCIALAARTGDAGYAEELAATQRLYEHPESRRRVTDFLEKKP